MTPAMAARRQAVPDAIAPASVKFDFWRSMRDLAALVMRSGAPGLRWRVAASLALVFAGKAAGVAAPVALGDAINRLAPGAGQAAQLGFDFLLLALAFAGLRLVAACAPNLRDMLFTVVAQSTMAKDAFHVEVCSLCHPFYTGKQKIVDTAGRVERFRQKYGNVQRAS